MKLLRAFSLIELLVIMVIIAVLSTIAVPVYKNYVVNGRAGSIVPIVESLLSDARDYANSNGHFPTAGQLALASTSANQSVANPQNFSQYFQKIKMGDTSTSFGAAQPCAKLGYIWGQLNPSAMGLPSGSIAMFTCLLGNAGTYIKTACYYGYAPTNGFSSASTAAGGKYVVNAPAGNLIPGWTNEGSSFSSLVTTFITNTKCM